MIPFVIKFYFAFLLITMVLFSASALEEDFFFRYEMALDGVFHSMMHADFNGDGEIDLFVLYENSEKTWDMALFFQKDSMFSEKPDLQFSAAENIVLIDTGDVVSSGGEEVVCLLPDGIYYYAFSENTKKPELNKLIDTDSLFRVADKKRINQWDFVHDITGNGIDDILVATFNGFSIYTLKKKKTWVKTDTISIPMYNTVIPVDFFFQIGYAISTNYSTPVFLTTDYNRDNRNDFIIKHDNSLLITYQDENGRFLDKNTQIVQLPASDDMQNFSFNAGFSMKKFQELTFLLYIADLNGDDLMDLVTEYVVLERGIFSIQSELRIHYGKESGTGYGAVFEETPDQVIKNKGVQIGALIEDLNGDGRDDLLVPSINFNLISLANIILSKKASFDFDVYFMTDSGRYPQESVFSKQVTFDFSFSEDSFLPVYSLDDYTGDGVRDMLTFHKNRELHIYFGRKEPPLLDKKYNVSYGITLPRNGFLLQPLLLNGDNKMDVVLTYRGGDKEEDDNRITLLLSKP